MTSELFAICFTTRMPEELQRFWDALLTGGTAQPRLRFVQGDVPKIGQNRMHFDLTSDSPADQERLVGLAIALGGGHLDIGQGPDVRHVVMADPDGNEFDVLEPGNNFTAGCGPIGAVACDGTQAVGYFWSAALGWPLVWDENEETAIQSPLGGTKISWGGPPVAPQTGRNRVWFDLVPAAGTDVDAERDRLISLGATPAGAGTLADPDGNEFRLSPGRR